MQQGRVERLIGVYDADGTIMGEISYAVGHLLGRRSCSLCDITHGTVRRRPAFDRLAEGLGVPFELLHRDEQSPAMVPLTEGRLPCVLAEIDGELAVLLERDRLEACDGAPDALFTSIDQQVRDRGLALGSMGTP